MMKKNICIVLVLGLIFSAGTACAHFTMVFPRGDMEVTAEDYIADVGETKTVTIIWGHPFEHILFDMSFTPEVYVRDPEGAISKLTLKETIVEGYKAYQTKFVVDKEGDWIVYVRYEDEKEELIDLTKTVIHCGEEAWFGWDAVVGQDVEVVPYTRPYGLEEGFVFTGKALSDGNPLAGASVEVEKYHTKEAGEAIVKATEDKYPKDPPMIFTRVTTSNGNGEFAYTLDEAGIWFVGATREVEDGFDVRGVFIVPVLEEFPAKESSSGSPASDISGLEDRINSLSNKISGMSTTEGTQGDSLTAYLAVFIGVIALITAVVAVMKK